MRQIWHHIGAHCPRCLSSFLSMAGLRIKISISQPAVHHAQLFYACNLMPRVRDCCALRCAQVLKSVVGQSAFQLAVMWALVFSGPGIFGVPAASLADGPSEHYTLVFNAFVCMQLFNQARTLLVWPVFMPCKHAIGTKCGASSRQLQMPRRCCTCPGDACEGLLQLRIQCCEMRPHRKEMHRVVSCR
jgi:hypothetical protein